MTEYLELTDSTKAPVRNYKAGDRAMVVNDDELAMVDMDSAQAAMEAKVDDLRAWIAGRSSYETLAEATAAGVVTNSIEVLNDPDQANNGLWYWSTGVLVKSPYDYRALVAAIEAARSDQIDKDAITNPAQKVPLQPPSEIDYIWGIFAKGSNKLLGWMDGDGVWHSNHSHPGVAEQFIAQEGADVLWGIRAGSKLLLWLDGNGALHSEHDHPEYSDQISELSSALDQLDTQVTGMDLSSAGPSDLLAQEVIDGGYSQISIFDGDSNTVISQAGSNWKSPVVHHQNVVRCFSDYTTNNLEPHTILPTQEVIPESRILMQQMVTGQSLSLGSRGYVLNPNGQYVFYAPDGIGDLFTPVCPADLVNHCLTLENGVRKAGTTLIPTAELPDGVLGETVCSSYMIGLARIVEGLTYGGLPRLAAAIAGTGGVPYDALKKGTSVYTDAINKTQSIRNAAAARGWDHIVTTIRIIHGESQSAAADPYDVTEAGYAAVIREWVSDYQTDIVAMTGQKQVPVGMVCQMNTQGLANIEIPLAQLKAHQDNSDIILIGPKYQHPYWDSAHMLAEGYVKTGELEAHAFRHWMAGRKWNPLMPASVSLSGTLITVTTNNVAAADDVAGPVGNLVIDTATISDPGSKGFQVSDPLVSITSVTVSGSDIFIQLNAVPAAGTTLSYALQTGQSQPGNGPRGNIRDSDDRVLSRFDGQPIRNWLVAFRTTIN